MINHWPEEIQNAVELIWEYSHDICLSQRTSEEADEDGYEVPKGESAWVITAYLPMKQKSKAR